MNRARYISLPTEVRDAIDALSGRQWSRQIGRLWNVWDDQVRERSLANGSEIITPDASTMQAWRHALRAPTHIYLDELSPTFPRARTRSMSASLPAPDETGSSSRNGQVSLSLRVSRH